MSEFPRPLMPNEMQWNRQRVPYNPQWRPFYKPRAPFHPRNRGLSSYNRLPMNGGSEEHWCETCDRGFPSEYLLGQHKQQHQKCNIDGCQFVAHPKVITKHIQMQHSSGLYKKIAKLNNPEEIEKWREERRKKYPTKLNIENKAAALKEKIERGEKINLERKEWHSTRDKDPNRHSNSGQGTKRSYHTTNHNQSESKFRKVTRRPPRKPKDLPQTEENRALAPFAGIQCLGIDITEDLEEDLRGLNNDPIEDDEIGTYDEDLVPESDKDNTKIIEKHVVCSALSLLMCDYGTSDEEIDVIEKPHKSKEIDNVNKIGNQSVITKNERELWRKTEIISQPTNMPNETRKHDIANEVKNINELSQNSVTEIVQNSCNKGDSFQNNMEFNDHSSNGPLLTETKLQNAIMMRDSGTKAENNNDKPASSENNNPNIYDEDDDDSGPEEIKVDKNADTTGNVQNIPAENKTKVVKKKYEAVKRKSFRKPKPKIPSTLIYRLLSKEMRQERNQILQCIRYICMNNYFEGIS